MVVVLCLRRTIPEESREGGLSATAPLAGLDWVKPTYTKGSGGVVYGVCVCMCERVCRVCVLYV